LIENKIHVLFHVRLLKQSPSVHTRLVFSVVDEYQAMSLVLEEVLDLEFSCLRDGNELVRIWMKWKRLDISKSCWQVREVLEGISQLLS